LYYTLQVHHTYTKARAITCNLELDPEGANQGSELQ